MFVDDEPNVLHALKALLRPLRFEWEMVFVGGATEALSAMRSGTFDVVVSDMRMPQVDGAELLKQVRDLSPATRRLVLSGYADEASLARAAQVAHRCLDKPCELEVLRDAIDSVTAPECDPALR
jgi:CheY-like chemotaxis protein